MTPFDHARFITAVLLIFTGVLRAESVPNGDFEKQDGAALAAWEPGRAIHRLVPNADAGTETLHLRFVWDTESRGAGKGSLRIDGRGLQSGKKDTASGIIALPANDLMVQPETDYRLTWFFKSRGLSAQTKMETVVFLQSPGPLGVPPNGSRFLAMKADTQSQDAGEWKQGSLTFRTPKDVGWAHVRLQVSSADAGRKFSVRWDDFTLTRADGTPVEYKAPDRWTPRSAVTKADAAGLDGFKMSEPTLAYGSGIQRTMRLLATSTAQQRNRVKILFYGQSIIAQNWWKVIIADLRARFPNADIVAENPSIGGFTANWLKDTMFADCYPANADLICFHDYAGPEKQDVATMFDNLRRLTTAEVMVFTHHVAGQPGWSRMHDAESDFIKQAATERGFEIVDIRSNWKRYLEFSQSKPSAFLKDVVHLAPNGEALWAKFSLPHFVQQPDAKPAWRERVQVFTPDGKGFAATDTEYPTGGVMLSKLLKFSFEGRRVDLLSHSSPGVKLGTAKVLIDGKAPSTFPELYFTTTSTRPPDFFWPMLRRAEVGANPVLEDWKIAFSNVSADGTDFAYDVTGSVTGPDGNGNEKERFVSKSGRLVISPECFMIAPLMKQARKGKPYPDGTTCSVSVRGNFLDQWKPSLPANPASEDRYTLANGLAPGPHTLEIIPNNDGDLPLRAIIVHRP
jgi:hypothetical protein